MSGFRGQVPIKRNEEGRGTGGETDFGYLDIAT